MNDLNDNCPWPHVVSSPIRVYDRDSYDKYQMGEYKLPERCICGATLAYAEPVAITLVECGVLTGERLYFPKYPLTFVKADLTEPPKSFSEKAREDIEVISTISEDYESFAARATENLKAKSGVAGEIEAQKWSEGMAQTMGCSVPKVVCPECKQEVPWPSVESVVGSCIFCGEDHGFRECPEYPEQWDKKEEANKAGAPGIGAQIERIKVVCKHSGKQLDAWAFANGGVRWSCPCGHFIERADAELPSLPDEIFVDDDCRWRAWREWP